MPLAFDAKAALVTGAAAGIGLAAARAFAEAGAAVALADIDEEAARAAAQVLVAEGHKAIGLRCDVTDETSVAAMVEKSVSAFGRLDAAFNNAGIHVVRADTRTLRETTSTASKVGLSNWAVAANRAAG